MKCREQGEGLWKTKKAVAQQRTSSKEKADEDGSRQPFPFLSAVLPLDFREQQC